MCLGDAEHGHDLVPDELLNGAAVMLDRRAHLVEVAEHELADALRVQLLTERGRAGDVAEEERRELAPLGGSNLERRTAGIAEPRSLGIALTATRTDGHRGSLR